MALTKQSIFGISSLIGFTVVAIACKTAGGGSELDGIQSLATTKPSYVHTPADDSFEIGLSTDLHQQLTAYTNDIKDWSWKRANIAFGVIPKERETLPSIEIFDRANTQRESHTRPPVAVLKVGIKDAKAGNSLFESHANESQPLHIKELLLGMALSREERGVADAIKRVRYPLVSDTLGTVGQLSYETNGTVSIFEIVSLCTGESDGKCDLCISKLGRLHAIVAKNHECPAYDADEELTPVKREQATASVKKPQASTPTRSTAAANASFPKSERIECGGFQRSCSDVSDGSSKCTVVAEGNTYVSTEGPNTCAKAADLQGRMCLRGSKAVVVATCS